MEMHAFLRCAVAMALFAFPAACRGGSEMCTNDVVSRLNAPGGTHAVATFERSCGATTGFSTQISILSPGEVPKGKGNAFVADDDHGATMAGDHETWMDIQWLGPDHLLVRHAAGMRILIRREEVAGVRITYQPANEL